MNINKNHLLIAGGIIAFILLLCLSHTFQLMVYGIFAVVCGIWWLAFAVCVFGMTGCAILLILWEGSKLLLKLILKPIIKDILKKEIKTYENQN